MSSGVTGNQPASQPPIFVSIQTSAFSGATLLARLLGAHPQIATVGEMDGLIAREDPQTYLCSCGEKIRECSFWRAVQREMEARGHTFDIAHFDTTFAVGGPRLLQRLRSRSLGHRRLDAIRDTLLGEWPSEQGRIRALVDRNEAFIAAVLAVTGKQVFVDTSKDRLRLRMLRRYGRYDVRAIHLVRDVRGVVASRLRRGAPIDAQEAARQWYKLHQKLQRSIELLPPDKRMRVRYEDLCRDMPGTLSMLSRFCGVDPSVATPDLQAPQHIVGNAMRLRQLGAINCDERWRSILTSDQLRTIDRTAGRLSLRYGYR